MKKLDFECWKALNETACALLLVFSFVGADRLKSLFVPFLLTDLLLIAVCNVKMIFLKRADSNTKSTK